MHHIAVFIAQHLNLDVLRLHQKFLHEDVVIAEGLFCFSLHQIEIYAHIFHGVAAAHTSPAASCGGFQNHREAELHGQLLCLCPVFQRLCRAGGGGHAALQCHLLGRELVAHHIENPGTGADELDACCLAGAGKVTIFAQKAVAGMDGICPMLFGKANDPVDIQIGPQRAFILANEIGLIRRCAEQTVCIFIGVDRYGLQPQIVAGPEDPHGNLAPVCHQDLFERSFHIVSS